MTDLEQRLATLEKSNRHLKLVLSVCLVCGGLAVGLAAAPDGPKVLTADKIIIGSEGKPSVLINSDETGASIEVRGADGKMRCMIGFVESNGASMLHLESNTGAAVDMYAAGDQNGNIKSGESHIKVKPAGAKESTVAIMTATEPRPFGFVAVSHPDGKGMAISGYNGDHILFEKKTK